MHFCLLLSSSKLHMVLVSRLDLRVEFSFKYTITNTVNIIHMAYTNTIHRLHQAPLLRLIVIIVVLLLSACTNSLSR